MRRARTLLAGIAVLSASAGGAAPPAVPRPVARPARVMSINLCTDQILLALLPPARIASVSWLARDPESSLMSAAARRVAVNHGLSEEVVRQRPDLVVAGTFAASSTRAMLRRLGWPMIEVPPADSFADIRRITRRIARAVGEPARGERLIAMMDADLARLARDRGPPLRIAAWDGAGFGAGAGTLYAAILRATGAINVAADPRLVRRGMPDTELLLAAAPALIVRGGLSDRGGLRSFTAYHPIVRRFWGRDRTLVIGPAAYTCGTPFVGRAALALRRDLRARAAAARSPLPFAERRL